MARLRFQKFEKELSPVGQEFGIPSYPAPPPPQQMVGDEVLSESRAYERLGESILDFGTTLGKVITNEQGRIRKEVWEQGMPVALAELDERLEQKMREDYQYMSPSQVGEQWDSDLVILFGDGKDKIGDIENSEAVQSITHEGDRKRLMALLRVHAASKEIGVLRQQYALENLLQASRFSNQVRDGLDEKLREILHHDFDHESYNKDDFTEFLNTFSGDLINQAFKDNDIHQGQRERLTLEITSEVNNWRNTALLQNYTIRQGIGKAIWEGDIRGMIQTGAKDDPGFRRRTGDKTEDSRIPKIIDKLKTGVDSGYILPVESEKRLADYLLILDTNDLNYDLEKDPELAMARLSRPEFNTPENRIEYFAEYGFKINKDGEPTEGKKTNAFRRVETEWKRLTRDGGKGYYPTIIKNRQKFYEEAVEIVNTRTRKDVGEIRLKLRTLADVLRNPASDPESLAHARAEDRTSQYLDTRGLPNWELEQWELILMYSERVREEITNPITEKTDLHLKSKQELADILKTLDPDKLPQYFKKDGKKVKEYGLDKDNYRISEMRTIYGNTKLLIDAIISRREEDQAAMGFGLIIKGNEDAAPGEEVKFLSDEAVGIVLADIVRYNGGTQSMPTAKSLPGLIQNGTFAIWSMGVGKQWEGTWNKQESGEAKQDFLLETLNNYDKKWHPSVLQEMIKLESFSRVDQLYMVIVDPGVLNHLYRSQVDRDALREGSTRFFNDANATVENIKKEIAFGSDGEAIRELLLSFYGQPAVQEELVDAFVYYTIQLASTGAGVKVGIDRNYKDVLGGEDENKASTNMHLIQSRYAVIEGGGGERARFRIPRDELQGLTADDMEATLKEFTPNLLELRKDDDAWNFVRGEDDSFFGDTLYQWITNSDESGVTLLFFNEQLGGMDVAEYNGIPATLTWEQLRNIVKDIPPPKTTEVISVEEIGIIKGLIELFEGDNRSMSDRLQWSAEEMDLQNTPANLYDRKKAKIDANRANRAERRQEEAKKRAVEKARRIPPSIEEIKVRAEPQLVSKEVPLSPEEIEAAKVVSQTKETELRRKREYKGIFWFVNEKRKELTKEQIAMLMDMTPKDADVALREIRAGG